MNYKFEGIRVIVSLDLKKLGICQVKSTQTLFENVHVWCQYNLVRQRIPNGSNSM